MIREFTVRDELPEIQELLALATSREKTAGEVENYLQEPERTLYVTQLEGEVVGCIGIERKEAGQCEIRHIAVSLNMRGRQIGSKMIAAIQQKHKLLQIYAETDQDAVGFYQSCGFAIKSLGEKYPGVERFFCEKQWSTELSSDAASYFDD